LFLSNDDRAILKNLMLYLKAKSLTSKNMFKRETKEVDAMFMDLLSVFQRYNDNAPETDKQTLRAMIDLIILVSKQCIRHTGKPKAKLVVSKTI
jgi:hypothetical protein